MKTRKFAFFLLFVLSFIFSNNTHSQCPAEPTITTIGSQYNCLTDTIARVEILIEADSTCENIDYFLVFWNYRNNTEEIDTIFFLENTFAYYKEHYYNFSDLYKSCIFSEDRLIWLKTTYRDGKLEQLGTQATFRNPPNPKLYTPSIACIGQDIFFDLDECPMDSLEYFFEYGDGNSGDEEVYKYNEVGIYEVSAITMNPCSTVVIQNTLEIIPSPESNIVLQGSTQNNGEIYTICIGTDRSIQLDGSLSISATRYDFKVLEGGQYSWEVREDTLATSILSVQDTGYYAIELEVRHDNCEGLFDKDTIQLRILDNSSTVLFEEDDRCESFEYTPSPYNSDASYTINGMVVNTFPISLDFGEYFIKATVITPCDTIIRRDTFSISNRVEVEILSPLNDTTICLGSPLLSIITDENEGTLSGTYLQDNVFNPMEAGLYTIYYSKGTGDCKSTDSLTINVLDTEALEQISLSTCNIQEVFDLSVYQPPFDGTWQSIDCPSCIVESSFFVTNLGNNTTATASYLFEDATGCENIQEVSISISPPNAEFTIASACSNMPLEINSSNSIGSEFLWRVDGIETETTPTNLTGGLHTIEMVAISGECRDSSSVELRVVNTPINAQFSVDTLVPCTPFEAALVPNFPILEDVDYRWYIGGYDREMFNTYQIESISFDNPTDTIQTVQIIFENFNSCDTIRDSFNLRIPPQLRPELGIDSTTAGCSPRNAIITNRSQGIIEACYLYRNDTLISSSCDRELLDTLYALTEPIDYEYRLVVFGECDTLSTTMAVRVNPPTIIARFNGGETLTYCPYDTIQFIDASTPIPDRVIWYFGDGTTSTEFNPQKVYGLSDTTLKVTLHAFIGCEKSVVTHEIILLAAPKFDFNIPEFGCTGLPVEGIEFHPKDLFPKWDYGNGHESTEISSYTPTPIYEREGKYSITVTAINPENGCSSSPLSKELTIRNHTRAGFYIIETYQCEDRLLEVRLVDTSHYSNNVHYRVNERIIPGDFFEVKEQDIYTIEQVVDYNGKCPSSLIESFPLGLCSIYAPNIIYPNGNGDNRYFTLYGNEAVEEIELLEIYNRWGDLVFKKENFPPNDPLLGWDGKFLNKSLNLGVYVFHARVKVGSSIIPLQGEITLIN